MVINGYHGDKYDLLPAEFAQECKANLDINPTDVGIKAMRTAAHDYYSTSET